ncbi:oxygenase MpaB family protein [Nevskia soli]|uniref:oxygenase MpaB family protein n=1 Tax=Nevskia soli TaxID=418856 RepID=UPI000AD995FA|nr:oxygenase MpaB family protein [Nevskia soli]
MPSVLDQPVAAAAAPLPPRSLPPGFIPSRHGAAREQARGLLGTLRLVMRGDPEPDAARWQAMGEDLMRGDAPADRLVEWMLAGDMKVTRPLFERALENGIESVPEAPAPLREFFAVVERRPDWVDMKLVAEGALVNDRGGMDYFLVDRDLALMGGYQASAFNKALLLTGALQKGAGRRVAETVQWWLDCTEKGGMERFGVGFKSTVRVRMIHALVRRHVGRLPQWRLEEWGLPINQVDMAATALAFPMVMLLGGRMMGVPLTRRDSRAAMHLGRYAAWLIGVEDQWVPRDEREGRILLYQFSLSITNPDETSKQLGQALMNEPLQRPYTRLRWLRRRYQYARHLSVSRFFVGRAGMRNLGLPENVLPWYPLLRAPPNLLWRLLVWLLPGGRQWQARHGRRATIAFVRSMTGPESAQIGQAARHITEAAA